MEYAEQISTLYTFADCGGKWINLLPCPSLLRSPHFGKSTVPDSVDLQRDTSENLAIALFETPAFKPSS